MTHIISNSASFHAEARYQRVCAKCGKGGPFHAHHVIKKQIIRRAGHPQNDTRLAMRLCTENVNNCHFRHERGLDRVPLTALTDEHYEACFEALGARAYNELRRYYAGDDPRLEEHLERATAAAA